jgi:glutathione S-transferase
MSAADFVPTIYGDLISGNSYKPKLLLELLGRPYRWVHTDVYDGTTRKPAFLRLNPNGSAPVAEIAAGEFLAESNALLYWFAVGTPFWPEEERARAQVLQWLFFEQYSHEPVIAVARSIALMRPQRQAELPALLEKGRAVLALIENHLAARPQGWFVGEGPTIADIALYAYTHVAHEGGFDLAGYAAIRAWLARIEALPGYHPMR